MENEIIAIVNDHTGKLAVVKEGYEKQFGVPTFGVAKSIQETKQYGEWGEHCLVKISYEGYTHCVSSESYSVIFKGADK